MKKLVLILPVLLGVLLSLGACRHHHDYDDDYYYDDYYYDDYYHDGHYHNSDYYYHNCYNYIRNGNWFPASHEGLTRCEYESWIHFNDWEVLYFDCTGMQYDRGTYSYRNGWISIHYDNGDFVEYYINKASHNEFILRARNGIEYHYVRN